MLRGYIDLWLRDFDEEMYKTLVNLGFKAVAVEDYYTATKRLPELIVIRKKIISAESRKELRDKLRGIKSENIIVSVRPLGVEAARMAAHDRRVDTIIMDDETLYYIDKAQLNLMKDFNKPLEICVTKLLCFSPKKKAMIYRRINFAIRRKIHLVLVSCASSWNHVLTPISLVYFFSLFANIPLRKVLEAITSTPHAILARNGVKI